jgi:hypothetical protein
VSTRRYGHIHGRIREGLLSQLSRVVLRRCTSSTPAHLPGPGPCDCSTGRDFALTGPRTAEAFWWTLRESFDGYCCKEEATATDLNSVLHRSLKRDTSQKTSPASINGHFTQFDPEPVMAISDRLRFVPSDFVQIGTVVIRAETQLRQTRRTFESFRERVLAPLPHLVSFGTIDGFAPSARFRSFIDDLVRPTQPETGKSGRQAIGLRQFRDSARHCRHDHVCRCRRNGRSGAASRHVHDRRQESQRPPGPETGWANIEQVDGRWLDRRSTRAYGQDRGGDSGRNQEAVK